MSISSVVKIEVKVSGQVVAFVIFQVKLSIPCQSPFPWFAVIGSPSKSYRASVKASMESV